MHAVGERGFTFVELVVVIVIIALLLPFAIARLLPYLDEAERVGVLTTESQIRSSLMMSAAKRIANGRAASVSEFDGINPMVLLLETPGNYVGEFSNPRPDSVPRRRWYFDLQTRRLVYHPGRPFSWLNDEELIDDPEFEVQISFEDSDGNGVFDPAKDAFSGVRPVRAAGAEWLAGQGSRQP